MSMAEMTSESEPIDSGESVESSEVGGSSETEGQVAELQQDLAQAAAEGATKKELQQMIKEFELKVNGKTVKKSIDLSNEEELKKELQKAMAFNDVSQTHSNMVKQLNAKIAAWKQDPESLFRDLELDPLEFSEKRLAREVEELKKTPEEKKYEEQQRKLLEYEEKERKYQEQLAQQQAERENAAAYEALRGEIKEAFDGHEGLKYNEDTEREVADMMARYSEKYPDITASQVIPLVEKEMQGKFNRLLESMSDDYLAKFLSKGVIEKIAAKAPKKTPPAPKKMPPTTSTQVAKPSAASVKNAQAQEVPKKRSFEDAWRK